MERVWNGEMFEAALRCWESGQDRDETTCKARERQGTRYFWAAMGMVCPTRERTAAAIRVTAAVPMPGLPRLRAPTKGMAPRRGA